MPASLRLDKDRKLRLYAPGLENRSGRSLHSTEAIMFHAKFHDDENDELPRYEGEEEEIGEEHP